jgi:fatty-acyl-CoA synthase
VRLAEIAAVWSGRDLTEVHAFCRDQIAHYKVPRHVRFVREFPMTVTGKMQKNLMREAMERELAATPKAAE